MSTLWPAQGDIVRYISAPPPAAWMEAPVRSITLLGSTGSIGVNTLRVLEQWEQRGLQEQKGQQGQGERAAQRAAKHSDLQKPYGAHLPRIRIRALACARNVQRLAEQAARWRPEWLGVLDGESADALRDLLPQGYNPRIVIGQDGYSQLATLADVDTVLSAQVGAAGLQATVNAALAGKVICLANKESLVLAGNLIRHICARTGASILPVDSEHNAIFQALSGRPSAHVRTIVLTASGGPFYGKTREQLYSVTQKDALRHPNWSMGAKITIDSATLMNKCLEVMEAYHLYGVGLDRIEVLVHPQSIVHSLVEFTDGSLMGHFGTPDMRMPIAHCVLWPHCADVGVAPLRLANIGTLTFAAPDISSFPCLALAGRALRERRGHSVVLNAANEAAVALFLEGRIGFMDIPALLTQALDAHAATCAAGATGARDARSTEGATGATGATGTKTPTPYCLPDSNMDIQQTPRVLEAILALDAATRRQVHHWVGHKD